MKNLILYSCRSPFLDNDRVFPPLSLLYLKSYLAKYNPDLNVRVSDDFDLDEVKDYDAVGISIMTPQRQLASQMARQIKERYPDKLVIAGGPHIDYYFDDAVKEKCFDILVPGDGEKALSHIAKEGFGLRKATVNMPLTGLEVLSTPVPDRTSINAKEILYNYDYKLKGRPATTMMTARGCPEKCTFCEAAGTTMRKHNLGSLVREMDEIENLGFGGVYIFDDTFALSPKIVEPIARELQYRDLIYRCNGHARYMTDDFARLLANTGCVEIAFGTESGSQKILDVIRKGTTVEQNYKFVDYCNRYGIDCKAFLMIGLPGETRSTLFETEEFIRESGIKDFQLAVYTPFKGTQIRRDLDEHRPIDLQMLVPEVMGAYGVKGGESTYEVRTKELSSEDLHSFRDYLLVKYRPKSHEVRWSHG